MAETAHGRVDRAGRLVTADDALLSLQRAAGAMPGEPLAVPALARVARLAQMLDVFIARRVLVADDGGDFDVSVAARPQGDEVLLALEDWSPRVPKPLHAEEEEVAGEARPNEGQAWHWATDATLRLTRVPDGMEGLRGAPLTRLVRLLENDEGDYPLLAAAALRENFADQRAVRRDRPDIEWVLAGKAVTVEGRFAGFEGFATLHSVPDAEPRMPDLDAALTSRLDQVLRVPLARIISHADAIRAQKEGPLRRDYADYAGDIASAGRHLLGLVDDLADLDAIERPDFAPDMDAIDLADIARRAAGLLQVRASDRGVRIDRPAASETLPARGEFRRVLQILVNLIGNAVRYSPPGSMIWLRSEGDAETAVMIVADQGKGIDPADQERIFDKFERVDQDEPGGSGLGLYIARRLARAMGGDVTVDSAPGQGARFVLTLPAG